MSLSSFPSTTCWRDCLYSIGYSFLLCQRFVGHTFVGPFLGSLFCSIDLSVCSCASTIPSWWLQLCNTAWSPELWCLQLWFSLKKFFLMFIYFWQTERDRAWVEEGRERGRHRIWSRLRAVSTEPDAGLEPPNCEFMTRAEVGRLTDCATHVPLKMELLQPPLIFYHLTSFTQRCKRSVCWKL